jgi:hypothetical protein
METIGADGLLIPWSIAPEPFLEFGGGAHDELFFGSVRRVLRLSNSVTVISDGTSNELLLFASDGTHIRTMGGRGDGPGEFRGTRGALEERSDVRPRRT